jgi:hypothetical protein
MLNHLYNKSSSNNLVVIHQPDFLSYLGFFHRLLYADLFIVLDDVQYVNSSSRAWTNRDKIKTQNGEKWLTVNVEKSSNDTLINQIKVSNAVDWKKQNLNLIKQNYKKSQYFDEIFPCVEKLYAQNLEKLADFNMASILMILELFDIKIDINYSSSFKTSRTKSERLVDLLIMVDASHYLSGLGAKGYHDDRPFNDAKIEVIWQNFQHPVYSQMYGDFIQNLSSIDLFFNCGIEQSRKILRRC